MKLDKWAKVGTALLNFAMICTFIFMFSILYPLQNSTMTSEIEITWLFSVIVSVLLIGMISYIDMLMVVRYFYKSKNIERKSRRKMK